METIYVELRWPKCRWRARLELKMMRTSLLLKTNSCPAIDATECPATDNRMKIGKAAAIFYLVSHT